MNKSPNVVQINGLRVFHMEKEKLTIIHVVEDAELISLAGQIKPLPDHILPSRSFIELTRARLLELGRNGRNSVANAA